MKTILKLNIELMKKTCKIKLFISDFFHKIYTFLLRREPCILYRRPYSYNIDDTDGFANECPFCKPTEKIIEETDLFIVLPNKFPYPRTKNHILVCPKRHIKDWMELTTEELIDIRDIMSKYMKEDYTLLGREFAHNKDASVHHLHIHLIKGK